MFFCFLDTRLDLGASKKVVAKFSFCNSEIVPAVGQCGGVILLWNEKKLLLSILDKHDHFLHILCTDLVTHNTWFITFLYMVPQKEAQLNIWNLLLSLKPHNDQPWVILGHFNCIISLQEKLGGLRRSTKYMHQFVDFLNNARLICIPSSGNIFTWCNNQDPSSRIYERLDRVVVSASWLNHFPQANLNNLPIYQSDHGPICLSLNCKPTKIKHSFKFEVA